MSNELFNAAAPALPGNLSAPSIAWPQRLPLVEPASQPRPASVAERLIEQKHAEYTRQTRWYRLLYFTTRLLTALCAVLLPFLITASPRIATVLSITVAVCIAIDVVFSPKDLWSTYSKATDLLTIARLKQRGEYDEYKDALNVLLDTEAARMQRVKDMSEVLSALDRERKG
jgi:hypothetical protein